LIPNPPSSTEQQIIKGQLRVVNLLGILTVANPVARHFKSFTHGVEVKSKDMWGNANGRNTPLASQASNRRLADLQYLCELPGSQKFFALFHDFDRILTQTH
jgi:hypothetical protein